MKSGSKKVALSHVAVLVPSVRKAADYLRQFEFTIGKEEDWDGEGTREIYVELGKANSLLLMEPIKEGAYRRALEKRGPGFHHFAIDVLNLESYVEALSGTGWLLHPTSLKTIRHSKTAYLARPGFPSLIEVQERESLSNEDLFVDKIYFNMNANQSHLLEPVGLSSITELRSCNGLSLAGKNIELKNLWD